MKAISLWQPWASLVAHGLKRFETRHWTTSYRGPLAIHAAKRKPELSVSDRELIQAVIDMGYRTLGQLPYGCIVCTCELVDIYPTHWLIPPPDFTEAERSFGNYAPGRFAWRLDNVQIVDNIPARGSQGFWEWTP